MKKLFSLFLLALTLTASAVTNRFTDHSLGYNSNGVVSSRMSLTFTNDIGQSAAGTRDVSYTRNAEFWASNNSSAARLSDIEGGTNRWNGAITNAAPTSGLSGSVSNCVLYVQIDPSSALWSLLSLDAGSQTNLNASALQSGTIPTARYGSEIVQTNRLVIVASPLTGGGSLASDLNLGFNGSLSHNASGATNLQLSGIAQTSANTNQVIGWNGLTWTPMDQSGAGAGLVSTSRVLSVTGPITGGGALDADRTFGFDGSITHDSSGATNLQLTALISGTATNNQVLTWDSATTQWKAKDAQGSAGSGEANTGANIGSGVGLFKDKTDVTLNFKSLTSGNSYLSIANVGDTNVNFTFNTLDLVSTGRTFSVTGPLTGGGNFSADRTLGFDGTQSFNASGSTNLNAGNLASGTIPTARYGAEIVQTSRTVTVTSPITGGGSLAADRIFGFDGTQSFNASGATNLNAGNLASGTVPVERLSGVTTNLTVGSSNYTSTANIQAGSNVTFRVVGGTNYIDSTASGGGASGGSMGYASVCLTNWAGHGSIATKISYFKGFENASTGAVFSVVNDSTNGCAITVLTDGMYSATYSANGDSASFHSWGITTNSADTTVAISSICSPENLAYFRIQGDDGARIMYVPVNRTVYAPSNTIFRAHDSGGNPDYPTAAGFKFSIQQIW